MHFYEFGDVTVKVDGDVSGYLQHFVRHVGIYDGLPVEKFPAETKIDFGFGKNLKMINIKIT